MKRSTLIFILLSVVLMSFSHKSQIASAEEFKSESKIEHLTADTFKEKVFDYKTNADWKYEGDLPAIVDFYADWCRPCKIVAPILEELQKEYEGKIVIYKVNVDNEKELASVFQTQSIPAFLFIPKTGQPQMAKGALPKETFEKVIKDVLMVK